MKILITSDWNTYAINGVVTSINNLVYELRARGHEVKTLTLSSNRATRVTDDGWEVASFPAGKVYPGARVRVGLMNKIYDKIIEWGPDIIHSQCEMSTFVMAHHLSKECMVPIVHTYHTVYEDYTHYVVKDIIPGANKVDNLAKAAVSEFSKLVSGQCAAMIAPTEKVRTLLSGYDCKCPIFVVPTGIDLKKYRKQLSDDERQELRNRYSIKDDEIIALFLGRVAEEKNLDEVMLMLSKYNGSSKIKLLIAGDGPYFDNAVKYSKSLDIKDNIIFAGMINPEEVWKYYQLGDFFVSASTSETQGLTYIEALSSGLPLLCKKDDCLADVIVNNQNGYMFDNEDEFMYGLDFVLELISNNDFDRVILGKTADKFSREIFGSTVENIYLDALNNYHIKNRSFIDRLERFRHG